MVTTRDAKPDADQFNSIHEKLIEAWRGAGTVDFVRTFAVPLPVRVIAAGVRPGEPRSVDMAWIALRRSR